MAFYASMSLFPISLSSLSLSLSLSVFVREREREGDSCQKTLADARWTSIILDQYPVICVMSILKAESGTKTAYDICLALLSTIFWSRLVWIHSWYILGCGGNKSGYGPHWLRHILCCPIRASQSLEEEKVLIYWTFFFVYQKQSTFLMLIVLRIKVLF